MEKLYANENFPAPVVMELRNLGHDVLTIEETVRAGQAEPDHEVLATAAADGRAVVTHNRRHFIALHRQSAEHRGIIVCTADPKFRELAIRVHEAIERSPSLDGELLRVNRPST
jgi:hypothetical protein